MLFLETVRRSIHQHQLFVHGDTVIVGVSGGADSIALMLTLHNLQHTLGIHLHIATLDHGWRGKESADDMRYVVEMAQALNLPVTSETVKKTPQGNIEAAGRKARHDFVRVAQEIHATHIALAHHADDQAETVLMHLLRGAGLNGLTGMSWKMPFPHHPDLTLVRPFLGVTRAQIEAFCQAESIEPRHDPTNDDLSFLRNRLRYETLPYLRELNPNISETLTRLADVATQENHYIESQIEVWLRANQQGNRLPKAAFRSLHSALQRRVIHEMAKNSTEIGYEHITQAQAVCATGGVGAVSLFPDGIRVRVDYEWLVFEGEDDLDRPIFCLKPDQEITFTVDQPISQDGGTIMIASKPVEGFQQMGTLYLLPDVQLTLRTRRAGDRIALPGLDGRTQKLSHWMINSKVPRPQREYIPLLTMNNQIVGVIHLDKGIIAHPHHYLYDQQLKQYFLIGKI